jgi:hypothetical protein
MHVRRCSIHKAPPDLSARDVELHHRGSTVEDRRRPRHGRLDGEEGHPPWAGQVPPPMTRRMTSSHNDEDGGRPPPPTCNCTVGTTISLDLTMWLPEMLSQTSLGGHASSKTATRTAQPTTYNFTCSKWRTRLYLSEGFSATTRDDGAR